MGPAKIFGAGISVALLATASPIAQSLPDQGTIGGILNPIGNVISNLTAPINNEVLPGVTFLLSNFTATTYTGTATSCDMNAADEYSTTSPEAVGIDSHKLKAALSYAAVDGSFSTKVFRNGCEVGQGFRDALMDRVPSLNAGQTKAIVALIAGIVADRGWVDLDAPIDDYVEPGLGDAAHRSRTLRQFMQLTSGAQVNHVSGLNLFADISRTREYFSSTLQYPAGTYYQFDEITPSVVVYCLERAIQKAMGTNIDFQTFAQLALFDPLGIPTSAYFWQKDRSGVTTGYSGLWLRPLEFGRIGLMLLNNGTFGGCRILSEDFVQSMRQGTTANCGFGLYVSLNSCQPGQTQVSTDYPSRSTLPGEEWIQSAPNDMYYSLGLGTNTFVIPSLNMVVTRDGYQELDIVPGAVSGSLNGAFPGNAGGPGEHEFFRLLMASITNMPTSVRATIQNSGPYDRPANENVTVAPFILPLSAPLGTYTAIGPHGPVGCNALYCPSSSNDGLTWLGQVPRVIPGLVGLESRPSGCEAQFTGNVDLPDITIFGEPVFGDTETS
ncbi:hypothetical protein M409DRAFT_21767 [Zasmidium cellare ATCC 36951]|uniref:Beta-lactamase-related domain-containing protein n=1 Tax=Zasmidium cellare ATCC 36951 TaxID=1080233 RepID=A0A6A6CNV1_ZASCE|nr:uncharacterized protein M409DRAFT_21767 [Zasmidium cellare ATCC 36951]KAF2168333.1 hypothetical protein M409DRAFT_21767 [Zasmidium cellare ATCC 36951]